MHEFFHAWPLGPSILLMAYMKPKCVANVEKLLSVTQAQASYMHHVGPSARAQQPKRFLYSLAAQLAQLLSVLRNFGTRHSRAAPIEANAHIESPMQTPLRILSPRRLYLRNTRHRHTSLTE